MSREPIDYSKKNKQRKSKITVESQAQVRKEASWQANTAVNLSTSVLRGFEMTNRIIEKNTVAEKPSEEVLRDHERAECCGLRGETCVADGSEAANLAASDPEVNPLDLRVDRSSEKRESTSEIEEYLIDAEVTDEVEFVASFSPQTRYFAVVNLPSQSAKALIEPGMPVSLISSNVAEKYRDRLIPRVTKIRAATGEERVSHHILNVRLVMDDKSGVIPFRVIDSLDSEMILGASFAREFEMLTDWARERWRLGSGQWRAFEQSFSNTHSGLAILAELAASNGSERMSVHRLRRDIVPEPKSTPACVASSEHSTDISSAHPVKDRSHRRSLEVSKIAKRSIFEMSENKKREKQNRSWICSTLNLCAVQARVKDWKSCRRRYACFRRTRMKSQSHSRLGLKRHIPPYSAASKRYTERKKNIHCDCM